MRSADCGLRNELQEKSLRGPKGRGNLMRLLHFVRNDNGRGAELFMTFSFFKHIE